MAGIGAAGFGGGFGQGLASVLLDKRAQDRQDAQIKQAQQERLLMTVFPQILEQAAEPAQVLQWFETQLPDAFGKGKDSDAKRNLFLGALTPMFAERQAKAQQADATTMTGSGVPMPTGARIMPQAGGPMSADASRMARPQPTGATVPQIGLGAQVPAAGQGVGAPTAAADAGAQPGLSAFGIPLLSREEMIRRQAGDAATMTEADLTAKIALARKMATEHNIPLEDAFAYVGLNQPYSQRIGALSGYQSIAGELPDGTPLMAVFDKRVGQYVDPASGQPIPGFRPRTSTGSRTLGGDRESLAIEMFGKPASQLNADQMRQVNARLPEFEGQRAYGRMAGSGTAQNETRMQAPLTVDDAAQLQVPIGSNMEDVRGQVPMTTQQQATRQSARILSSKLPELELLLTGKDAEGNVIRPPVIADKGTGLTGRIKSSLETHYKVLSGDPTITQLRALSKSMAGEIAQVVQGQKGVLSDQDVERANAILTDTDSWLSDTPQMALAKLNTLKAIIAKIDAAIPNPQATGQSAPTRGGGSGRGATVAPATPKAQQITTPDGRKVWALPAPPPQ